MNMSYEAEYSSLRAEILNCTNLANQISIFSMTALAAVFAFAFSLGNPFVFLIPYIFILPLASKTYHYRKNVVKIAAYLITNLEPKMEDRNWETLNLEYCDKRQSSLASVFRNFEFFFEATICFLLFLGYLFQSEGPSTYLLVAGILAVVPVVCTFFISKKGACVKALKQECLQEWRHVLSAKAQNEEFEID